MKSRLALILFCSISSNLVAQISLTTSPYTENFNNLSGGLPQGISIRTGANATSLGSSATLTTAATAWGNATAAFKNFASATLGPTANTASQVSSVDRALGLRQSATIGDPGGAFVLQINNTLGKTGLKLTFDLQSLDASSPRTATWAVDYGIGANPSTFTRTTTSGLMNTGGSTFSNNSIPVDFGTALDNLPGPIWIRIIALATTTGSGNRPTSGIDNLNLTFTSGPAALPSLSASVNALDFGNQIVGTSSAVQTYTLSGSNLIAGFIAATAAPFSLSKDNLTFASTASFSAVEAQNPQTIYVRVNTTTAGPISGNISNTSLGASAINVSLSATGLSSVINTTSTNLDFGNVNVGSSSTPQAYLLSGKGLVEPITVRTSAPFEISKNNSTYGTSLTYTQSELDVLPQIFVRYRPTLAGASSETILHSSNGALDKTVALTGTAVNPALKHVVISEIYGGGGNAGSTYKNDFIELYNPSDLPVNLTGWSVQYAGGSGTSWQVTPLSGIIAPKSFYLIKEAAGAAGAIDLPSPDKTGNIAMAASSGKVLLANISTAQSGAMPSGTNIIDFVGFGAAAAFEGSGPTASPSATTSVERKASASSNAITLGVGGTEEFDGNGFDSNDNTFDFVAKSPTPQNSTSVEPHYTSNPFLDTNPKSLTFSNQIVKTTSISKSYILSARNLTNPIALSVNLPFSISKDNINFSNSLNYSVADLNINQTIYVRFSPKLAGNAVDTISHASAGADPLHLILTGAGIDSNQTEFNFENCTNLGSPTLADGFYQYSVTGAQRWACTTSMGHDNGDPAGKANRGNALQINGFSNGNVQNEVWLISPSLNLSAMNYAVLCFWSRSAFAGDKLQLKISTNYGGTGDPNLATWTTIDGKFPEAASDLWTKSDHIDLTEYKANTLHIAFVYTSTSTAASKWTIDDLVVTNRDTPPPVDISVSPSSINFSYQSINTNSDAKPFTFSARNLTGDVNLTAPPNFSISATSGGIFSSTLNYSKSTINNSAQTVYVRFSPLTTNTTYEGDVTVSTPGSANKTIALSGNTFDVSNTLEVVNWNIEWFGSPVQDPPNDVQQAANVKTIINNINADVYAIAEVVDTTLFRNSVLPAGYNIIFSEFGSYADHKFDTDYPLTQKLAFMYKTDMIHPLKTYGILRETYNAFDATTSGDGTAYKNWSSGRFPYAMDAEVSINGKTEVITFILIHAKANTGTPAEQIDAYNRRKAGNFQLKSWIDANLTNKKVIVLGDFNDVLDPKKTIAPLPAGTGTSYIDFIDDTNNYFPITLPQSLAGKQSTASFNTVIDNVIINKNLNINYIPHSAEILDGVKNLVNSYSYTTTDHYPIRSRYLFGNGAPNIAPISNSTVCYSNSDHTIALDGISAGPELGQNTTLSVSTNNPEIFDKLTVQSTAADKGIIVYHLKNNVSDTANIVVTITDDGGTAFGGVDSFSRSFTLIVKSLPTASINGTATVFQNSSPVNITFTGGNGVAPYTFIYNLNGGANRTVTTSSGNSATIAAPTNLSGTFVYNLVSVADANCAYAQTGSATVTIRPLPTGAISGSVTACINSPSPVITFTGTSGTAPYTFSYTINNGSVRTITTDIGNSVALHVPTNTAGTFNYALLNVADVHASQTQTGNAVVTIHALPGTNITSNANGPISKGTSVVLTATGAISYFWAPLTDVISGAGTDSLTVRPQQTTTYTLTGINANGCMSTKSITISVDDDYQLKPLNILSPNGDGKNDKFTIENIDYYPNNRLKIFDRSGRIIYTKQGYANDWDGTYNGAPLASDTYYYIIDFGNKIKQFTGYITIVKN